jgi:hypothetical protein
MVDGLARLLPEEPAHLESAGQYDECDIGNVFLPDRSLAVAAHYAAFQSRDREGAVSPEYVAVFMKRCTKL